ncbi:MAG: hypothetical protein ABW034_09400 [Steroidobacteraceae bacterium]
MLQNQIPAPPHEMVMPPIYGVMLVVNFVVLAAVMVWILKEARRTQSFIPVLIMAGATVASLTECLWDVLGAVWYPQYGHTPLYRLFNVSVPLWMLAAYPCYLGGQGYWVYKRFSEGMTQTQFWKFYAFAWFTNFLLEIPVLQLGVYAYYGPQPFKVLGFPLWQAMGNALMPILIGALVYVWRDVFAGIRGLMLLLAIPVTQVLALGGVGWPTWLAINSGRGLEITVPASLVTFALSLMIAYLVSVKLCIPAAARVTEFRVSGLERTA